MGSNARKHELKARGMCVVCAHRRAKAGRTRCQECGDAASAYQRDKTAVRRAAGLCLDCGRAAKAPFGRCCRCRYKIYERRKAMRAA